MIGGKRPSLGKGLGDLGLSELLGDLDAPAVAVMERSADEGLFTQQAVLPITAIPSLAQHDQTAMPALTTSQTNTINAALKVTPIDLLKPGRYQPRKVFDETALQELADSIKAQGIIQPIVVRSMNNGYEIIAGERRWRAAQLAGLHEVPVIVKELSDEAALAMSLIENIQRKDLNVMEEAEALDRLIREFHLTHQEVAQAVGKSRAGVTNLLRLLKLNPDVRLLVEHSTIEMGHARALLALEGLEQSKVAQAIVNRGLSVRQAEELIRRVHDVKAAQASGGVIERVDPDVLRLQNQLAEKLGAQVSIQHTARGKGRLIIGYNSLEELQGILAHIEC